jgi:hypothetical protein
MKYSEIPNYNVLLFVFVWRLLGLGMVGEGNGLERKNLSGKGSMEGGNRIGWGENDCAKPQGDKELVGFPNG